MRGITRRNIATIFRREVTAKNLATESYVDSKSVSGGSTVQPFIHLNKTSGSVQNVGGANGSVQYIEWDDQVHVDAATFTHETSLAPDEIIIEEAGRYEVKCTVSAEQLGANRTTIMLYLAVDSVEEMRGVARNYSRGSGYGDLSCNLCTEIVVDAGAVVQVVTKVDDTDGTYVLNTIYDQCELIIRKVAT